MGPDKSGAARERRRAPRDDPRGHRRDGPRDGAETTRARVGTGAGGVGEWQGASREAGSCG